MNYSGTGNHYPDRFPKKIESTFQNLPNHKSFPLVPDGKQNCNFRHNGLQVQLLDGAFYNKIARMEKRLGKAELRQEFQNCAESHNMAIHNCASQPIACAV